MAHALETSFDEWIRSLLNELQSNDADMSDFVQYLMGIVTSDSETDDEKLVAITELLADLDLKVENSILSIDSVERLFSIIIRLIRSVNKYWADGIHPNKTKIILIHQRLTKVE